MGIFRKDLIISLSAETKLGILKEIAEFLQSKSLVRSSEEFFSELLKREEHSTTGVGFGIAIPHAKSPAVQEPFVLVGKCQQNVDWDSLDGEPVKLVFTIGVPQKAPDEHLRILAKLSAKLMHEDFRDALFRSETPDEIFGVLQGVDANA